MRRRLALLLSLLIGCAADTQDLSPTPSTEDASVEDQGPADTRPTDSCLGGPLCTVDFPCRGSSMCASERSLQTCRTVPCEEACGTPCCSGGGCNGLEIVTCPPQTACYQNKQTDEAFIDEVEARCLTSSQAMALGWVAPDGSSVFGCR